MARDYLFQHIPYSWVIPLNHLLSGLDVVHQAALDQLMDNEGLKQLDRHFLGQTTLVNLEFEKYTGNFTIVFNPLGQIVGVEFPQKQP
jgi:hypothetical protein